MRHSLTLAALLTAIFGTTYASSADEGKPVIASVAASLQLPRETNVAVELLIEKPPEFAGGRFHLITELRDQAAVAADFPAGTRISITLPTSIVWELENQRQVQAAIQRQLDAGIRSESISQVLPPVPFVRISNLQDPHHF